MDLIGGYLLILLVLFSANIGLLIGNYKLSNIKLILVSAIFFIMTLGLTYASYGLNAQLSFLLDNFAYLFLIITVLIFASMLYYSKTENFRIPLYVIIATFIASAVCFSSQTELGLFNSILYSLFVFVIMFVVYQLTKLLHHAKRTYPVIVSEYMSLFSVLTFIFALTYNSTKNLDYSMFSPFLILTPTYQLIYVIIGIVVVLVIGVLINDAKGGNK